MTEEPNQEEILPPSLTYVHDLERLFNLDLHTAPPLHIPHTAAPIWTLCHLLCSRAGLDSETRDSTAELVRWANTQGPAAVEIVCKVLSPSEVLDDDSRPALGHLFLAALEDSATRFVAAMHHGCRGLLLTILPLPLWG